jgi:hypothetical protein
MTREIRVAELQEFDAAEYLNSDEKVAKRVSQFN